MKQVYRRFILKEVAEELKLDAIDGTPGVAPTTGTLPMPPLKDVLEVDEFPEIDCSGCGSRCCQQPVPLTEEEAARMKFLGADVYREGGVSLFVKDGIKCIFVKPIGFGETNQGEDNNGCSIHSIRPSQCRPFDCRIDSIHTFIQPTPNEEHIQHITEVLVRNPIDGLDKDSKPCNDSVGRMVVTLQPGCSVSIAHNVQMTINR